MTQWRIWCSNLIHQHHITEWTIGYKHTSLCHLNLAYRTHAHTHTHMHHAENPSPLLSLRFHKIYQVAQALVLLRCVPSPNYSPTEVCVCVCVCV